MKSNKKLYLKIDNWCIYQLRQYLNMSITDTPIFKFFKNYFSEIEIITEKDQIMDYLKFRDGIVNSIPVLSLDPLIKSEINIEISRAYNIIDNKLIFIGYIPRFESVYSTLEDQLNIITHDSVYLYDDIVYGGQFRYIESELLKRNIKIIGKHVQLDNSKLEYEILDFRDLIRNAPYGGLPITNISTKRIPYYQFESVVEHNCNISGIDNINKFIKICVDFNNQLQLQRI